MAHQHEWFVESEGDRFDALSLLRMAGRTDLPGRASRPGVCGGEDFDLGPEADRRWEHELMLRLREGDKIVALGRGASGTGGWWYYALTAHGPDQSWLTNSALSLDVIVQRGQTVQFLVPPPTPETRVLPIHGPSIEDDKEGS